jgi:hypothetical protein
VVHRTVRPPRVAVLISDSEGWEPGALRMMENYSRTWGGGGGALLACSSNWSVHAAFWSLLAAYDPDQVAAYIPTFRGWQMANPSAYEAWLDQEAAKWTTEHGGTIGEAKVLLSEDHLLRAQMGGWPVPDSLHIQTRQRLAPFGSKQLTIHPSYRADNAPEGQLTDISRLYWVPDRIRMPDVHRLPARLQVLINSRVGGLAPSHLKAAIDRGSSVETILTSDEDIEDMLEFAWTGRIESSRLEYLRIAAIAQGLPSPPERPHLSPQFLASTPMKQSEYGCAWKVRWRPTLDADPVVLVVGDSASDFAWAFTRERCVAPTLWCPYSEGLEDNLGPAILKTLARVIVQLSNVQGEPVPILVTTLSLPDDQIDTFIRLLGAEPWIQNGAELRRVPLADVPIDRTRVLLDTERFDDVFRAVFVNNALASQLDVAVPTDARSSDPMVLKWQIDYSIEGSTLPVRWAISPILDEDSNTRSVRSGADGTSYISHGQGFVVAGATLQQMLVRPQLRIPDASEVFASLLGAEVRMEESSAGHYTHRSIDLWGDIDSLTSDLSSQNISDLLHAWLAVSPSSVDPGVFCSGRRFLCLDDAIAASGLPGEELRSVIDRYARRSILRRGLVLGCQRCSNADFYPLEDIGPGFQCSRCRQIDDINLASWKMPLEPSWYYALDEVVYQLLKLDGRVPLLALANMKKGSRSFLYMPEVHLEGPGLDMEIDLWAIVDGRIVLGEAKKSDEMESRARAERQRCAELASVVERITADTFVLATAAPVWSNRTSLEMRKALDPSVRLVTLCGL